MLVRIKKEIISFGVDQVRPANYTSPKIQATELKRWLDEGRPLEEVLDRLAAAGVGRVLLTGIGRDGTLEGADLELTRFVVEQRRFAVIASGGVGTLADLDPLADIGCEAVGVGRALYDRRFTLRQALDRLTR